MFLLVNLFATFGALVLTIMGLAVALTYPIGGQRGHYIWMIAFVIVGIPASVAAIFVSRAHDAAWAPAPAPAPVHAARRIEPAAYAVRPAAQTRVTEVRVNYYGEHHNRQSHQNRPVAVTYEVRQTEQPAAPAPIWTPPRTSAVIPSNTFSCVGFTRSSDGGWDAGADTKPFDVGDDKDIVIRNQGPIQPGWMTVGGVDLYDLIDKKCGAAH
jgi:hypothetical protein